MMHIFTGVVEKVTDCLQHKVITCRVELFYHR